VGQDVTGREVAGRDITLLCGTAMLRRETVQGETCAVRWQRHGGGDVVSCNFIDVFV